VREKDVETLALLTVVTDNDARAANDLSGVTFPINLAKTSPAERENQDRRV
jgi:hypothetical protein